MCVQWYHRRFDQQNLMKTQAHDSVSENRNECSSQFRSITVIMGHTTDSDHMKSNTSFNVV